MKLTICALISFTFTSRFSLFIMRVVGDGGSVTALGHYGHHPRPRVPDRGTPSRTVKRVAPDKEGAVDNTLFPNRGRWRRLALESVLFVAYACFMFLYFNCIRYQCLTLIIYHLMVNIITIVDIS